MTTDNLIALQTEVQLLGWAESSTRGRTVTFQLPNDHDTHPLRDYAIKSGKTAGHRFQMVLVEINDQDEPVVQTLRFSQRAAILCKDTQFHYWAGDRSFCAIQSEADARAWLLTGAGITSRKEFDTNKPAADWLMNQVLLPYQQYQETLAERVL